MPTSYLIGVKAKTFINEKWENIYYLHIRGGVFIYALWWRVFHFSYLSVRPNRGPRQRLQRGIVEMTTRRGWKTPGSHSWADLNPATLKNMFPPSRYAPSDGNTRWVPRWLTSLNLIGLFFNSGKGYSCPDRDGWKCLFIYHERLDFWCPCCIKTLVYDDSVISLQKPNQSVWGFPQHSSDLAPRVYKSCWRLMRSTGAKSFPAAVASSFPAADALFSALATWWEAPGVEISLSYIMHDERFFE